MGMRPAKHGPGHDGGAAAGDQDALRGQAAEGVAVEGPELPSGGRQLLPAVGQGGGVGSSGALRYVGRAGGGWFGG